MEFDCVFNKKSTEWVLKLLEIVYIDNLNGCDPWN